MSLRTIAYDVAVIVSMQDAPKFRDGEERIPSVKQPIRHLSQVKKSGKHGEETTNSSTLRRVVVVQGSAGATSELRALLFLGFVF